MLESTQSNSFINSEKSIKIYHLVEVDFGYSVDRYRLEFFFVDGFNEDREVMDIYLSFMRFKLEGNEGTLICNGLELIEKLKDSSFKVMAGSYEVIVKYRMSKDIILENSIAYLQIIDRNLFSYFEADNPIWTVGKYQSHDEVGNLYCLDYFLDYSDDRDMNVDRFLDGDTVLSHVKFALSIYSTYEHYRFSLYTYSEIKYLLDKGDLVHLMNGESLVLEDGIVKLKSNLEGTLRKHVDSISYTLNV